MPRSRTTNHAGLQCSGGGVRDEKVLLGATPVPAHGTQNILIMQGDESGAIPSDAIFNRFHKVFKIHLRDSGASYRIGGINRYRRGLYHFPLLTVDGVPALDVLPFAERKYSVYFCGNLNANRFPLYKFLRGRVPVREKFAGTLAMRLKSRGVRGFSHVFNLARKSALKSGEIDFSDKIPNSYLHFYDGFNKGAPYAEYANFLQNSRVVLSPCGFSGTECFRFYEAMRQGCVVVTEPLPAVECYENAPCITLSDWKNLPEILADEQAFAHFSPEKIKKFYDENLSTEGIARYLAEKILED